MDVPPLPLAVIEFASNNPHAQVGREGDKLVINKPWGFDDLQLLFSSAEPATIEELRYIMLSPQMDALLHLDTNEAEFIFTFLDPADKTAVGYLNREFRLHFGGMVFECGFRQPSTRLFSIAARFRRLPSERGGVAVPQLIIFRDSQRRGELPPAGQKYFETRVPRCFFVKPSVPLKEVDWGALSRHLNLLMTYYDRSSPQIVFRDDMENKSTNVVEPLRFAEGRFPSEISFRESDDILLRLIDVARGSTPRSGFIYCFQVFEYAAFYFIDAKSKTALAKLLRSPSFISCAEERVGDLLSILTEVAQNDDVRIRRVVEECCDPKSLWREILQDREFFSNDIEFDGGFLLPKLIAKDTTEDSWCAMWTPKLIDQITRIRNCLVHAREKRESKVILPTSANDQKILRFFPLARRMAEQIVLHGNPT